MEQILSNIKMKLKNKKILITGGSGFIGTNLIFELLKHTNKIQQKSKKELRVPDILQLQIDNDWVALNIMK